MARPTVVEFNYIDFKSALEKAVAEGKRIERTNKERWRQDVTQHRIKEAVFEAYCRGKFEGLSPVIIDDPGPWGGYYLVSSVEEACLKWVRPED
jgi:hypothetical protein